MIKKQSAKQKIALERIYRLFELAAATPEQATRYITLAKKIGTKTTTPIPHELKIKVCKKCASLNTTSAKSGTFLVITCKDCGAKRNARSEEKV